MNRYLLTFYKKDNMRFISHLDLQTLFQRTIKRGGVKVAYSNGFNPHELINIVQPLSLGYESHCELLELDTETPYDSEKLIEMLNLGLPEGIKFIDCIETERKNKTTGISTKFAEYLVSYSDLDLSKLVIDDFLAQNEIIVLKHDKKSDGFVEKNVKELVDTIELIDGKLFIRVCCSSNRTLNPSNLLTSLFAYSGYEFKIEYSRITRTKIIY